MKLLILASGKGKRLRGKTKSNPKGDVSFAIRFFKRALKDSGTLQELKDRKFFEKKSDKKRKQMLKAKYHQRQQTIQDNL